MNWRQNSFGQTREAGGCDRRRFLRCGAGIAALIGRPQWGWGAPERIRIGPFTLNPRACVLLFMEGGPSHIDTFDPKPALARYHGRPVRGCYAPVSKVYVASPFGFRRARRTEIVLNEELEQLSRVADRICVLRGVAPPNGNHTLAQASFLPGSISGQLVWEPRDEPGDRRLGGARTCPWDRVCVSVPAAVSDCLPLELGAPSRRIQQRYGVGAPDPLLDRVARCCLAARKLLERGVRYVQVTVSGWDAHVALESVYRRLLRAIDQPIAALIEDLAESGSLSETLVIWAGEFGRAPFGLSEPGQDLGREHNAQAMSLWMAGAGLPGGIVLGATDELGEQPVEPVLGSLELSTALRACWSPLSVQANLTGFPV